MLDPNHRPEAVRRHGRLGVDSSRSLRCPTSDQPPFCHRHAHPLADDDVIEQPDVHQRERLLHALRDELVGMARLGDAGRVLGFIS